MLRLARVRFSALGGGSEAATIGGAGRASAVDCVETAELSTLGSRMAVTAGAGAPAGVGEAEFAEDVSGGAARVEASVAATLFADVDGSSEAPSPTAGVIDGPALAPGSGGRCSIAT